MIVLLKDRSDCASAVIWETWDIYGSEAYKVVGVNDPPSNLKYLISKGQTFNMLPPSIKVDWVHPGGLEQLATQHAFVFKDKI